MLGHTQKSGGKVLARLMTYKMGIFCRVDLTSLKSKELAILGCKWDNLAKSKTNVVAAPDAQELDMDIDGVVGRQERGGEQLAATNLHM